MYSKLIIEISITQLHLFLELKLKYNYIKINNYCRKTIKSRLYSIHELKINSKYMIF